MVRDHGLGDGLTDGEDLGAGTATSDAHSNVEVGEAVLTQQEDGLEDLHSQGDWLHNIQ